MPRGVPGAGVQAAGSLSRGLRYSGASPPSDETKPQDEELHPCVPEPLAWGPEGLLLVFQFMSQPGTCPSANQRTWEAE